MPIDLWRKAGNREVRGRARREYAEFGSRTLFPYIGNDDHPAVPIPDRATSAISFGRTTGVLPGGASTARPVPSCSLGSPRWLVLTSEKIWQPDGKLQPNVREIVGLSVSITPNANGTWAWFVRANATGVEASLEAARVAALERVFLQNCCLLTLAELAGISLSEGC